MARASMRKPNLAMRIRDELGEVYEDARFVGAFGVRGRPGISPAQLMIVSVLQFSENLTDRQAADAVRDRITWKYALGLDLDDAGFDASVLSEFRSRLVASDLVGLALDALLERLMAVGLLKAGGRARTDSTHVLGAIASLNRLELAAETMRAALEALAAAAPAWLGTVIEPAWQDTYAVRGDGLRAPRSPTKRVELMTGYGRDGYLLLDRVHDGGAAPWLRQLPAVQTLGRIWVQQFYRQIHADGRQEVRRRENAPDGDGLPPGRTRLISCYDLDARTGIKRETRWGGYKIHVTETCDPAPTSTPDTSTPDTSSPPPRPGSASRKSRGDHPNLITNVATTPAASTDIDLLTPIHQDLTGKNLLPGEHFVDSGYASTAQVTAAARNGVTLIAPLLLNNSPQARTGTGYDQDAFTIDFDTHQATCPQQNTSSTWNTTHQNGTEKIIIGWPIRACRPCPARDQCTTATRRTLTIHTREHHQTLTTARARQSTQQWKTLYNTRAGVEGTIRQITHVTGIRHARYRGLPKTTLEHTLAATAINLTRLNAHWNGHPLDRTRTTHLARLDLTKAAQ